MNKIKIRLTISGLGDGDINFVIGSFIKPEGQERWTQVQVQAVIDNTVDRIRNRLTNALERLFT